MSSFARALKTLAGARFAFAGLLLFLAAIGCENANTASSEDEDAFTKPGVRTSNNNAEDDPANVVVTDAGATANLPNSADVDSGAANSAAGSTKKSDDGKSDNGTSADANSDSSQTDAADTDNSSGGAADTNSVTDNSKTNNSSAGQTSNGSPPAGANGNGASTIAQDKKTLDSKRGTDGVYELTFDDVKFDMETGAEFDRKLIGEPIEGLAGERIRIRGYIYPTTQRRPKSFILVRDNMECCFGPGAALYDCIRVEMAPGKDTEFTTRPVAVEGTFSIEIIDFDGMVMSIYRLDADSAK